MTRRDDTETTVSRSETEEVTTHTPEGGTETRTHVVKEELQREAPPQPQQQEVETITTTTVTEY